MYDKYYRHYVCGIYAQSQDLYYEKEKHDICSRFKNPLYFIPVGKSLGNLVAVQASQIKEKCLFVKTNRNANFVFKFINHSEMLS